MAKIDFSQEVLDLDGTPMLEEYQEDDMRKLRKLTLGTISARALSALLREETGLSEDDKLRRGNLAIKIFDADAPLDLKVEEIALVKKMIGKVYAPVVVARTFSMLDPAEGN